MESLGIVENLFNGFYQGKKVFVTGHTGFKGSWLCLVLKKLGADVYGYALNPVTSPNLFDSAKLGEMVTSHIGDIRDYDNLLKVVGSIKPDIMIHMAAQPLVRESYRNPVETYQVNVMGTVNILEVARQVREVGIVLNVTTDKCYENKEWYWAYRENEPMGGYDPYSNSKACSELVTKSYRSSFFNPENYGEHRTAVASARAGNVIGGGDWSADRLIPDFIRSIVSKENIEIRNPRAIRPWQHVLECLSGYLTLVERMSTDGKRFSEAYNFGPEESDARTVEWIVKGLCDLWGEKTTYSITKEEKLHEANYLKLDCSKARKELKWSTKWNILTSLERTVEWNKSFMKGGDARALCYEQIEAYYKS